MAESEAQARAQAEAQTWLRAEAQARARDRALAKPEIVISEAPMPPAPQTATGPVLNTGGPVARAPHPGIPWPVLIDPNCTPSRGVFIHSHSIGTFLINAALRNVRVGGVPLSRP